MKILCFKFHKIYTIWKLIIIFFWGGGEEGPPEGKGSSIHKFLSQLLWLNMWKMYWSRFFFIWSNSKICLGAHLLPPGCKGAPIHKISISIIIGKQMKILWFKFHQNSTINKEFEFFWGGEREGPPGGKGASIHKCLSQLFLVNIRKYCVPNLIKISQ